jgi:hypothetical protein
MVLLIAAFSRNLNHIPPTFLQMYWHEICNSDGSSQQAPIIGAQRPPPGILLRLVRVGLKNYKKVPIISLTNKFAAGDVQAGRRT